MKTEKVTKYVRGAVKLPILCWLGGAVWVSNQPGFDGWDGLVWLYYVGRFAAQHFAALH